MILSFALAAASCGIPNLETPECAAARDAAKQFYSFHFGNEMRSSAENLKMRERFLTPDFYKKLAVDVTGVPPTVKDYFTLSDDPPRTFKIGECKAATPTNAEMQIQLYWRDDQKTVQQEVVASMVKQNDKWLLDGVGSKQR